MKNFRTVTAGLITLAASTLAGCLVSATPSARPMAYAYPPPPARPVPYAYQPPAYQGGYVVQVDTAGYPYIYVGKTPRYLPRNSSRYPYNQSRDPYSKRRGREWRHD